MNMNLFDIQEWAEQYSFDQLSEDKQEIVLKEMDKEEFNDWHALLVNTRSFLKDEQNTPEPDPSIYISLEQRIKKRPPLAALLTLRIPFYKAAAACLLVGLGAYFLFNNHKLETVVVEKEIPIIEIVHDTITREVQTVEYVIKNIPVSKPEPSLSTPYEADEDYSRREEITAPQMRDIDRSFGNTVVSTDALEQFKVKI